MCFKEARINEHSNCDPLNLPKYDLVTSPYCASKKGGLAMYIHESFFYNERNLYKKSRHWEAQFVDIYGPSIPNKVTIGNIYRPPRDNNDIHSVESFISEFKPCLIQLRREDAYSILCGDYNINLLKLNRDQGVTNLFEYLYEADFSPQITLPTRFAKRSCSLIDNILVNPPSTAGILDGTKINTHVFLKRFGLADHQPCLMGIDVELKKIHPPKFIFTKQPVENAFENIKDEVREAKLEQKTSIDEPADKNYSVIADTIKNSYEKNIPTVKKRFRRDRHKINSWMTDSILERIKEKDVLYNKIRKSKGGSKNTENYKEKLRDAVRETNRAISIAKKVHYSRQIEKFKNDSQKTWRTISEIMNKNRSKTKYPPFFEINGHKVTDKKDIANEFNTYFSTNGQKLADNINTEGLPSADSYLGNRPNSKIQFRTHNV